MGGKEIYEELLQVEKQLDFRAEREGRDKKERDDKKRAFKNLVRTVSHEQQGQCGKFFYINAPGGGKEARGEGSGGGGQAEELFQSDD